MPTLAGLVPSPGANRRQIGLSGHGRLRLKKVLTAFLVVIAGLAGAVILERVSHQGSFGPSAIIALSILGAVFLALLVTLLLYQTRYRETIARVWLVVVSISISYVAVDLLAGYFLIKPLSAPLVPDPYRHHKLLPNTHSYFEQRDFSYYQRVNNAGLRGRDIAIKKSPGSYRILMLGDSFTMGKGVEDHQTFSVLLEESLNRSRTESRPSTVEVLNGGVDSYAPILSFIQLTRDLRPLEPDMVVLNLDNSDLVQETAYRQQAVRGADGEITGVPGTMGQDSLNERLRSWTERNLYLTRLLLYYVNRLFDYKDLSLRPIITQANFDVAKHTLAEDTERREDQWRNIFESILRIKRYCSENGIEFVLTIYPWVTRSTTPSGHPDDTVSSPRTPRPPTGVSN